MPANLRSSRRAEALRIDIVLDPVNVIAGLDTDQCQHGAAIDPSIRCYGCRTSPERIHVAVSTSWPGLSGPPAAALSWCRWPDEPGHDVKEGHRAGKRLTKRRKSFRRCTTTVGSGRRMALWGHPLRHRCRPRSMISSVYSRYVIPTASARSSRRRAISRGGVFQAFLCARRQQYARHPSFGSSGSSSGPPL